MFISQETFTTSVAKEELDVSFDDGVLGSGVIYIYEFACQWKSFYFAICY